MTLSQSDVHDLLDAIRAGGDLDVVRKGVELVLQALIEAEPTEVIGAERYERAESRSNWRNGSRERLLATKAGDVELRIPKLRQASFFPSILERRRRIDRALFAVVMEAYVRGCRPARSTTWWRPLERRRGSPSPRCRASAPPSTRR